jgi:hypothetical protein
MIQEEDDGLDGLFIALIVLAGLTSVAITAAVVLW